MKFNKKLLAILVLGVSLIGSSSAEEINNDNAKAGSGSSTVKLLSYFVTFNETSWDNLKPLKYKLNGTAVTNIIHDDSKYKADYIKTNPWGSHDDQLVITSTDYPENEFQIATNTGQCSLSNTTKLPLNFQTTEVRRNGQDCIIRLKKLN